MTGTPLWWSLDKNEQQLLCELRALFDVIDPVPEWLVQQICAEGGFSLAGPNKGHPYLPTLGKGHLQLLQRAPSR